jgi:GT2 family glycosyltransferase
VRRLDDFLLSRGEIDLSPRPSSRGTPVVSVVIALFNRAELTLDCLRSLADCGVPLEVIGIDNASSDRTAELFSRVRGVRYVRNDSNVHFLRATNQGAALATGRHILLLNSDTVVGAGAIEAAVRRVEMDGVGAVGGRLILPDGTLQEAGCFVWRDGRCRGYGRGASPEGGAYLFPRPVDFCSGAFLLTPREVWTELGGLDETFGPAYYEEVDYCFRVWASGRSVVYEPRAVVHHVEFGSATGAGAAVELMLAHQKIFAERHRAVLAARPLPDTAPLVAVRSRGEPAARRFLVCDERLPHLKTGAGYPRANRLLGTLVDSGFPVTFVPVLHVDPHEGLAARYVDLPGEAEILATGFGGRAGVERLLRERPGYYTDIIISRPTTMAELRPLLDGVPELFRGVTITYDAEAIFAVRECLEAERAGHPLSPTEREARIGRELDLCRGVARVLTVSAGEAELFRARGFAPHVVGHAIQPIVSPTTWEARTDFVFVGAIHGDGGPNFDAVVWFLEHVWAALAARCPGARFVIGGLNESRRLAAGAVPAGVVVTGALDDLAPVYDRARVFVAPTRASAGIPLKVVEAAGRGVPVVATPLLVGQLGWCSPSEIVSADTAERFVEACAELFASKARWTAQREAALARVRAEYSAAVFAAQLQGALGFPDRR